MMSQLSCLSSKRLKKDVVDSLRPSRRYHVVAAHANPEMQMVLQRSYFGGKPLPLPKPEEAVAAVQQGGDLYDWNTRQTRLLYSSSRFEEEDDDDDDQSGNQFMFARTWSIRAQSTLCYPPPPVSSPTSSFGKCSPPVCKPQAVQQQEHPSLEQNGDPPPPPPPWSTSSSGSCSGLNEDSCLSPPWSSPVRPAMAPVTTRALILPVQSTPESTVLPCSGNDHRTCGFRHLSSLALDVADIRKDMKVLGLEEIKRACSDVGNREHEITVTGRDASCVVVTGWIQAEEDDDGGDGAKRKLVAVVWKHRHSRQGWNEWAAKVNLISRVDDPHICKLQGYYGVRGVDEQILVYEHVCRGRLSDYLFGSLCKALLDWRSRVRIALGAARALAYLHDLAPIEVVYKDFKSSNILLDLDFSVKLAGHGLDVITSQVDGKLNKAATAVLKKREASNRSNIRSYGVLLLELLTGKAIAGREFRDDENLFAQWAKPYLVGDERQLASILDPHLHRQLPCPGLKKVAALTLRCLRKDAAKRPSISEVVDILDTAMACKSLQHRRKTSSYKCMSLRRLQPSQTLKAGFSRTLSNKYF